MHFAPVGSVGRAPRCASTVRLPLCRSVVSSAPLWLRRLIHTVQSNTRRRRRRRSLLIYVASFGSRGKMEERNCFVARRVSKDDSIASTSSRLSDEASRSTTSGYSSMRRLSTIPSTSVILLVLLCLLPLQASAAGQDKCKTCRFLVETFKVVRLSLSLTRERKSFMADDVSGSEKDGEYAFRGRQYRLGREKFRQIRQKVFQAAYFFSIY